MAFYTPWVHRWARQAGLGAADNDDLVQEVFAEAAQHISTFRRDRPGDSLRAWLYVIARRKLADHFRVRAHRRELLSDPDRMAQTPDSSAAMSSGLSSRPAGAFPGLPLAIEVVRASVEPRTWEAFVRHAAEGRADDDVAAELDMTPHAVEEAAHRVRVKLRDAIEREHPRRAGGE